MNWQKLLYIWVLVMQMKFRQEILKIIFIIFGNIFKMFKNPVIFSI